MAALDAFVLKTEDQIRDDLLRTYSNALIRRGIATPNVSYGTEPYIKFSAIANQIAVAMSNTQFAADAVMPDSAQGDDLVRIAKQYGLSLRSAGGSTGSIVLAATVTTPIAIPVGSPLNDPTGLAYKVSVGGPYSSGDSIPIEAVSTGAATNIAAGTVLKWSSPPPFVQQTALVGTGGLTGGVDAETYEGLRVRLIEYIRNPPASGNWSQLNKAAEDSSTAVQKALTYPAANGPATVHMAVITAPTSSNKERDVDAIILATVVTPTVQAIVPEYAELVVTTAQNQATNASIGITIPDSPAASPPGPGGGWLDGEPFPVYSANGFANVTSVTSSTVFAVNSDVAPTVGVSRVCWLSPLNWQLYLATVTGSSGSGPYTITIDTPFVGIAVNNMVCPQAEQSQAYFDAFLSAFAQLGPGEKTDQAGVLPRAYRKPSTAQSWPSDLNGQFLSLFAQTAGDEVQDYQFLYKSPDTPPLPAVITDGPYILIPSNIGIYPIG